MGVAGGDSEHIREKSFKLDSFNKPPSFSRYTNAQKGFFSKVVNVYFNLNSALGLINCLESKTR